MNVLRRSLLSKYEKCVYKHPRPGTVTFGMNISGVGLHIPCSRDGWLDGLEQVIRSSTDFKVKHCSEMIFVAAVHGHVCIIRYCYQLFRQSMTHDDFVVAAENGHFNILRAIASERIYVDTSIKPEARMQIAFRWVCMAGNLRLAKLLLIKYPNISDLQNISSAFLLSARQGHAKIVEFILNFRRQNSLEKTGEISNIRLGRAMCEAASKGHISVMKLIRKRIAGNPELEKFEQNLTCYDWALIDAAASGQVKAMKLAKKWGGKEFLRAYIDCLRERSQNQRVIALLMKWISKLPLASSRPPEYGIDTAHREILI